MRDNRFKAVHRGGMLTAEQQRQLARWAALCAERVLTLAGEEAAGQLKEALAVIRRWAAGSATVGGARAASVAAHALARSLSSPKAVAVARAAGHAAATAHMGDHALGAAIYALKALQCAGRSTVAERSWQNVQLPEQVRELVVSTRAQKERVLKIH